MILGETATAGGGGCAELSDRFVAGFWWVFTLGKMGTLRYDKVFRQNFVGRSEGEGEGEGEGRTALTMILFVIILLFARLVRHIHPFSVHSGGGTRLVRLSPQRGTTAA